MARPSLWSEQRAAEYRRLGYWTDHTFVAYLEAHARQRPDAVALTDGRRAWTWAQARAWVEAVAASLVELGLPRDAVLATWLPNWPEAYLLRLACERAGLLWLPLPRALRQHELRPLLARAAAQAIVLPGAGPRDYLAELRELRPHLPRLRRVILARAPHAPLSLEALAAGPPPQPPAALDGRQVRPHEVAMLQPTSGSTGMPKLCEYLLHGAMARGRAQAELFRLSPDDVFLACVQGFGPSIPPLLAAPVAGARVVVAEEHDAATLLRLIERERVTIVCAVPPILRDLALALEAGARADLGSVRVWYASGMVLSPELARALETRAGGVVLSAYGGVDLGVWAVSAPEDPPQVRWFTVGKPRGGTELLLVDDDGRPTETGEVWGRGPSSVGGYFNDPQASRAAWTPDGWFQTGDVGRYDEDRNLVIVGRKAEVINRGGAKVYPAEVEHLLEQHPAVARAAVVPLPDDRLGERVCAYLVPRAGAAPTLEDLVAFLRARHLASYKLPEHLVLVPTLPTTSGNKPDRQALRADLAARLKATTHPSPTPRLNTD